MDENYLTKCCSSCLSASPVTLGVDLALKGEHFRRASENKALGSSGREGVEKAR